jgi:hypothetical protein
MKRAGNYIAAIGLILAMVCTGCQKELSPDDYKNCFVDKVEVFENGSSTAGEIYEYTYSAETLFPSSIFMDIKSAGFQKIIPVTFDGAVITLGTLGTITLDGTRRIKHLQVNEAYPGAEKGDYFYGYNVSGFLEERLFDDGNNVIERTIFSSDEKGFNSFDITYEFDPSTINGSLTYLSSPVFKSEVLYPYADLFPELLPFMMMMSLGKISSTPPEKMEVQYESPGQPDLMVTFSYSNFSVDGEGLLTSFTGRAATPGLPAYERRYSLFQSCR